MFATLEQVKHNYENPKYRPSIRSWLNMSTNQRLTDLIIERALLNHNEREVNHHIGKGVRPWNIVNIAEGLDPTQPWVGVEYETGWWEFNEYQAIARHVNKNYLNAVIDHEGCGDYPSEITLPPVNFDKFQHNDYMLNDLIRYQHSLGLSNAMEEGDDCVGTHINFSTPSTRALDSDAHSMLCAVLNESVDRLGWSRKEQLFNREPYGLFYSRSDGVGNRWFEGKLFATTENEDVWNDYKRTISNIVLLAEEIAKEYDLESVAKKNQYSWGGDYFVALEFVGNIYDILRGTASVTDIRWEDCEGEQNTQTDDEELW